MAVKNREVLRRYFETGNLPTASHFSDLIDSMVHRDQLEKRLDDEVSELMEVIGGKGPKKEKKEAEFLYVDLWEFEVPADGEWHELISAVDDVNAVIELTAEAKERGKPQKSSGFACHFYN